MHGMEWAKDGLQEKMEICHRGCKQRGLDRCIPSSAGGKW